MLCVSIHFLFSVLTPCGPLRWILDTLRSPHARPLPLLAYEVTAPPLPASGSSAEGFRRFSVHHSVNPSPAAVEGEVAGRLTIQEQAARGLTYLPLLSGVQARDPCEDRKRREEPAVVPAGESHSLDVEGRAEPADSEEAQKRTRTSAGRECTETGDGVGVRSVQGPKGHGNGVGTGRDTRTSLEGLAVVSADIVSLPSSETARAGQGLTRGTRTEGEDHEGAARLARNSRIDTACSELILLAPLSRGFLLLDDRVLRARAAQAPGREPRVIDRAVRSVPADTSPNAARDSSAPASLHCSRGASAFAAISTHNAKKHPASCGRENRRQNRGLSCTAVAGIRAVERVPRGRDSGTGAPGPDSSGEEDREDEETEQHTITETGASAEEGSEAAGEIEATVETTRRQLAQVRKGSSHALLGLGDFVFYSLLASKWASESFVL